MTEDRIRPKISALDDLRAKLVRAAAACARLELMTLPEERPSPKAWERERERQEARIHDLAVHLKDLADRLGQAISAEGCPLSVGWGAGAGVASTGRQSRGRAPGVLLAPAAGRADRWRDELVLAFGDGLLLVGHPTGVAREIAVATIEDFCSPLSIRPDVARQRAAEHGAIYWPCPYAADGMPWDKVLVVSSRGCVRRLQDHPGWHRHHRGMMPGEFWASTGDDWSGR